MNDTTYQTASQAIDPDNIYKRISPKLMKHYYKQLVDSAEPPIYCERKYATTFGINEGIFLSLLCRFCKPTAQGGRLINGKRWAFNTYEQWQEKYMSWLDPRGIQRIALKLEKDGYVESCQPDGFNKKKYYRPNEDKIMFAVSEKYPDLYPADDHFRFIDDTTNCMMDDTTNGMFINSINISNNLEEEEEEAREKISENSQNDTAKVFKAYESEIGVLTFLIADDIRAALADNVPPDWIVAAIGEASRNNKRNWSYVSAILKRWKVEGFQSNNKPQSKSREFRKRKPEFGREKSKINYAEKYKNSPNVIYITDRDDNDEGEDYDLQL